jgi:hypothetical protein
LSEQLRSSRSNESDDLQPWRRGRRQSFNPPSDDLMASIKASRTFKVDKQSNPMRANSGNDLMHLSGNNLLSKKLV